MSYRKELRFDFNPTAFLAYRSKAARRPSKPAAAIQLALTYVSEPSLDVKSGPNTGPVPEKAVMLQALRSWLSQVSQGTLPPPKALLATISKAWDTACALHNEIRLLEYCGLARRKVRESKQSAPAALTTRCILLARHSTMKAEDGEARTSASRFDIDFAVKPSHFQGTDMDIDIEVDVSVSKVYGPLDDAGNASRFSEGKIRDFLQKGIRGGSSARFGDGLWLDTVRALEEKLALR